MVRMQCQVCRACDVMRRCAKCGQVWCNSCAPKGKGHYPLQKDKTKCPYCGAREIKVV